MGLQLLDKSLLKASRRGDVKAVKRLLDTGADPAAADTKGTTPLHYAAQYNYLEISKRLIVAGADVSTATDWRYGEVTPLHLARSREMVELLLNAGAEPTVWDKSDMTPLHYAAQQNHLEIAERLIGAGANVSAYKRTEMKTPLHLAHSRRMAELLLIAGADPTVKDSEGLSSLSRVLQELKEYKEEGVQRLQAPAGTGEIVRDIDGLLNETRYLQYSSAHWVWQVAQRRLESLKKAARKEALDESSEALLRGLACDLSLCPLNAVIHTHLLLESQHLGQGNPNLSTTINGLEYSGQLRTLESILYGFHLLPVRVQCLDKSSGQEPGIIAKNVKGISEFISRLAADIFYQDEKTRKAKEAYQLIFYYLFQEVLSIFARVSMSNGFLGDTRFMKRKKALCSTMPWTIWPALCVLWGVCWMFIYSSQQYREWDLFWGNGCSSSELNTLDVGQDTFTGYTTHGRELPAPSAAIFPAASAQQSTFLEYENTEEEHQLALLQIIKQGQGGFTGANYIPIAPRDESMVQTAGVMETTSSAERTTGAKTFKCKDCQATFGRRGTFNRHRSEKHGPPQSQYFCPNPGCKRSSNGRGFARKEQLIRHMNEVKYCQSASITVSRAGCTIEQTQEQSSDVGVFQENLLTSAVAFQSPVPVIESSFEDFGYIQGLLQDRVDSLTTAEQEREAREREAMATFSATMAALSAEKKRISDETEEAQANLENLRRGRNRSSS